VWLIVKSLNLSKWNERVQMGPLLDVVTEASGYPMSRRFRETWE
jgi:hypothetical protein